MKDKKAREEIKGLEARIKILEDELGMIRQTTVEWDELFVSPRLLLGLPTDEWLSDKWISKKQGACPYKTPPNGIKTIDRIKAIQNFLGVSVEKTPQQPEKIVVRKIKKGGKL